MLLVENLKSGFAAMWAKSKAYADGKIRDDQTNLVNTWSSSKMSSALFDLATELYSEGGYYKGETTVAGLNDLFFTTPSSTWYKPGVYTFPEYSVTLGAYPVAGGHVLVVPVRRLEKMTFFHYILLDAKNPDS